MSDLNDLSRPVTTDTEPNVLDTLRAHIVRAATWAGWSATGNKVAGIMSSVTAAVSGGRSLRLYRRNDANTADEEVVSLPGVSVGGNAATASAVQAGSALASDLAAKAPLNSPAMTGTPTVPTATAGTNTNQVASTAFVATAVANLVQSAPSAIDTLAELGAALGNDANFAATVNNALGNRIVKTSAARPGVTKLYRADADTAHNVQATWETDKPGHLSLRGFDGDVYHAPVFVAYAAQAGQAGNAETVTYPFPPGTRMPFAQASAPTGWTQDTSDKADNRMLRVVKTAGGGVAGTHSPILNNVVPSHTHGFTTGGVSSDHSHYVSGVTDGGTLQEYQGIPGGSYTSLISIFEGGIMAASSHAHGFSAHTGGASANHTHSGGTDNGSSQTNWQPRYIDLIICIKN